MLKAKSKWPPTNEQIQTIAASALNNSQDKDVKVLVYWDNPTLIDGDWSSSSLEENLHKINEKKLCHTNYNRICINCNLVNNI